MKQRRKKKARNKCRVSNFWLFLIGGFLLVELAFLVLLAGSLSSLDLDPVVARRKILRFFDPKYRRREHHFGRGTKHPPFHHSQIFRRRDYWNRKPPPPPNQTGLDDFYTRPHITQQVPFLVVGGSDGSGTRTFVQTLMDLGVTMVVDNYDTMDVHGEEMEFVNQRNPDGDKVHGWPPLVELVLKETRSANYTVQNLATNTQQQAMEGLLQLKSSLIQKGREAKQRQKRPGNLPPAAHVQFGFKAPISMLLLPLLQQVLGPIKFLHVVRDGRDIAISSNQSPVEKFYSLYYGGRHPQGTTINSKKSKAAIQLWNDWNSQVRKWALSREKALDDDDRQTFDYLVMRTEDLIDPSTRLEALVQLAEFVGARVRPDALCCMSQQNIQDMGQSNQRRGGPRDMLMEMMRGAAGGEDQQKVKGRYGKWRQELQGQPELVRQLHDLGAEALSVFGYEPQARFLDQSQEVQDLACNEAVCS